MSKIILKYKSKFPIGCILKHKHCNLMYEVVDYYLGKKDIIHGVIFGPEYVYLKKLNCPYLHNIGEVILFDINILKEYDLYNGIIIHPINNNVTNKAYEKLTIFDFI